MKRFNLEATDENILNTIADDKLQRTQDIKSFIELLESVNYNTFLALDGAWGNGKTFFVRQVEMTLKYYNNKVFNKTITEEEQKAFDTNKVLGDMELAHTYLPIYFNSWLYDNHTNALMALLLIIIKHCEYSIDTTISSTRGDKLVAVMDSIQFWKSSNWRTLRETFRGKNILEEAYLLEDVRGIVNSIFEEILNERAEKLIVFIDELDRCRPTFAVELLESIKHYFSDDRIIFVMSMNKAQLIHTISNYYGEGFDSDSYLNKFFDMNIRLPEADTKAYFRELNISCDESYWMHLFANAMQKMYDLSIRDSAIYFQKINTIISKNKDKMGTHTWAILYLILPILCVLQIKDIGRLESVLNGTGFEIVKTTIMNCSDMQKFMHRFFGNNSQDTEDISSYMNELEEIYRFAFFDNKNNTWYNGRWDIYSNFKQICIRVLNAY